MRAHAGPERLGRYRLREQLGEGGMGVVYLASDPSGDPVAIKVLRQGVPAEATARHRLAREVDTMRRVHSPFVAEVVDADVEGSPPYIVTRYVAGRTLEDVVAAEGPLSGTALGCLAKGLAAALAAVHAAGVVHRDLKPGNVMLVDGQPVLIDFGIAQAADLTRLTMTGMFMGTPGYLAPEVIEGRASGPESDVHSWGATLAYAATGRPPFGTGQFEAIFYRIVHGQPDLDTMPVPLVPLVLSALARDPARRPSAAQLCEVTAALDADKLVPGPAGAAASAAAAGAAAAGSVGPFVAAGEAGTSWPRTALLGADSAAAASVSAASTLHDRALRGAAQDQPGAHVAGADGLPSSSVVPASPAAAGPAAFPAAFVSPAGAATGAPAGWNGTRPFGAPTQEDFGDLLTPVQYGPPNGTAGNGHGGNGHVGNGAVRYPGGTPAQLKPERRVVSGAASGLPVARDGDAVGASSSRWPLVLATLAVLIAVSVLLPVAGTAAALVVLVSVHAAGLTSGRLAKRRQVQGQRARGVLGAVAFFPLALVRSVLRFITLAPVALLCAAGAAVLTVLAMGTSALPRVGGFAAGALVACYCIGPGSWSCRRPLARFYGSITRSTLAAVGGGIGLGAIAAAAVVAAAVLAPGYWPALHLGNELQNARIDPTALGGLAGHVLQVGRQVVHWFKRTL